LVVDAGYRRVSGLLPRIIAAMLVGAALSARDQPYQVFFKSPLVSPYILGASAGADSAACSGNIFFFGVLGFIVILLIRCVRSRAGLHRRRKDRLDRCWLWFWQGYGSYAFSSLHFFLKFLADPYEKLPAITYWMLGSLASIAPKDVWFVIGPMALGLVPLYLLRWRLNVLSMGEEEAKALGLETGRLRIVVILCSTLVTSAAVSISGMIGFVGLVIPHLTRMIVGPDYKALIPASMLLGSTYLLLVDDAARMLSAVEVPLGILTSVIGAPFFIYLILRNKGGWR
jgi:iron complex transport system permease protein